MLTNEIVIRDPYILVHDNKYYMYGTRSLTCWGEADGFDCYISTDLTNWEGPIEIFKRPEGFWANKNYWAPEVHFYEGSFYMFATFNTTEKDCKGTMILRSERPEGPFKLHSRGKITPDDWRCLDGTFYVSKDHTPYMVFSHEWTDLIDGQICAVELSKDLTMPVGEPFTLFKASEAKDWVCPIHHRTYPNDDVYVTDGPFLYRCKNDELVMLWASFGSEGYAEAIARSDNGEITGNWLQDKKLLFAKNGGHGMLFTSLEGKLMLTLHSPNVHFEEHPIFFPVKERDGILSVDSDSIA